jgi:hypothetical protein
MKRVTTVFVGCIAAAFLVCPTPALAQGGGGGGGHFEVFGNNLSFPVIWAEGVTKTLRGTPGMIPVTQGEWMFWWGTTAEGDPLSCVPNTDATGCADGRALGTGAIRAYLQKDEFNVWQADSAPGVAGTPEAVNWIDWGDNLESQDWYDRSQVRTEVVLFKDLTTPMLEYGMRHLSGWGIDEIHGLAAGANGLAPEQVPGTQATVYSHCARLTIQKLLALREDIKEGDLAWDAATDQWVGALVNPPIFNKAVWEAGDGPGYYAAEINVKGRVIYGYTWNVRTLNDPVGGGAAGDYRITFSLDPGCPVGLNTSLASAQILTATEEEAVVEEEPVAGAVPVLDVLNNLTYADVRILPRTGGKVKIK